MDIFTFFVQEPSKIVLSFVLITYIFHFNAAAIDIFEILAKNWLFFNKFVSKQNSPNLNCLQNRRVFSDSSFTFLNIIFNSSLNKLNIQFLAFFHTQKLDISCHMLFQMLIKRKNSDRHIMDVSIFMKLMIHHPKSEFYFFLNVKITSVRRNVGKKKFSSSFFFQQVLLLYLNWCVPIWCDKIYVFFLAYRYCILLQNVYCRVYYTRQSRTTFRIFEEDAID